MQQRLGQVLVTGNGGRAKIVEMNASMFLATRRMLSNTLAPPRPSERARDDD
jgi:hypothetical protein